MFTNQQQMMYGNGMYGQQYPSTQFGIGMQQRPMPKYTQPLTPEQINRLRTQGNPFKIEVTEEDLLRAACTHKENGQSTLVYQGTDDNGNEVVQCAICGEKFSMVDYDEKELQNAVDTIINLLQTSKTMYLDAPANLVSQYYQMIPLLKKFPQLYQIAMNNFSKYEMSLGMNPGTVAAGGNAFQMMGNMLANPYAAVYGGTYGQPMYAQPMQQPMMGQQMPMMQQPMQNPWGTQQAMAPFAQAQPMMGNPFMYGAPAAPAAPAPQPAVPPVAPQQAAPVEGAEVQQTKSFNV